MELAATEREEVAAPARAVWAYRLDFTNLPAYNPDVTELVRTAEGAGPDGLGVGARYRFTLATSHGPHTVNLVVSAVAEGAEVSATMEGAMTATETFRVAPLGEERCSVSLSLHLDLPPGLAPELRRELLDNGQVQIRKELDAMSAVFAARAPGSAPPA